MIIGHLFQLSDGLQEGGVDQHGLQGNTGRSTPDAPTRQMYLVAPEPRGARMHSTQRENL